MKQVTPNPTSHPILKDGDKFELTAEQKADSVLSKQFLTGFDIAH